MQRLLFPIIILVIAALSAGSILKDGYSKRSAAKAMAQATKRKAVAAESANKEKISQIGEAFNGIARGRDFLADWQSALNRSVRGGIDNAIQELSLQEEVNAPTPRDENAKPLLQSDRGPIMARRVLVAADGNINGLARFAAETERLFPLGSIQSIKLIASDRDPKLEIEIMQLDRIFAPMPDLPPDAPPPEESGILGVRPETQKIVIPHLPDNLVTRGFARPSTNFAGVEDMSKVAGNLKVTGVVWSVNPKDRLLLANGYVLRPEKDIPESLITGKGVHVRLIEIGRDFAKFAVEKEVFNAVTNKTETESSHREIHFTLMDALETDG
jgi:hypothetical protein